MHWELGCSTPAGLLTLYELDHEAKWLWISDSGSWPGPASLSGAYPPLLGMSPTPLLALLQGFGDPAGEYWLGNEAVHQLTSSGTYSLRVELQDWEGNDAYAQYEHFQLGSEGQLYRWARVPGGWAGWGPGAGGFRDCTQGQSLGVSASYHLSSIWAHVTGSGGGCFTLNTSQPRGGVERRWLLELPSWKQARSFQG